MPEAIAASGSPTRATPTTCPARPRMGPVQYRVVPAASVLRNTYLSPWASVRPASTAATAGSDTKSPLDDWEAAGPSGPRTITCLPCRSSMRRSRLGTAALATTGVSKRWSAAVSWLVVASGTPVVAAAARSVVRRAASTNERWSLASKLARSRLPLNSATASLVTRAVTAAVPIVPISATISTNGPTIFARRERRITLTSPIIRQGDCAGPCAGSASLRGTLRPDVWYSLHLALIPEQVRQQLKDRFETVLTGPVHLTVYTRPGSSRLILPAGVGCATCEDARQMAELLRDAAPEKITMEVVDVARDEDRAFIDEVVEVPTVAVGSDSTSGRIRFQGLATGTEFPALIDAIERVSRGEHGLSEESVAALAKLTEPTEVMVFATPT